MRSCELLFAIIQVLFLPLHTVQHFPVNAEYLAMKQSTGRWQEPLPRYDSTMLTELHLSAYKLFGRPDLNCMCLFAAFGSTALVLKTFLQVGYLQAAAACLGCHSFPQLSQHLFE